jgi:cytochrome oxidase Cu insertion factor (SCO1/SenC/PrrC family)
VKPLIAFFQIMFLLSAAMAVRLHTPNTSQRSSPIGVGEIAPDFTLEDQNRNKVTLSDARGKSTVVLVLYRGYW